MSQENVEIVRRWFDVTNHRDWSRLKEFVDPDIEIDLSRNIFNPDTYHGYAGFRKFASGVEDVWDDFNGVPTDFIDAGDRVVVAVTMHGKGKQSGVDVTMHVFVIYTVRDSRILRIVGGYRDRSEALKAAGLKE